MNQSMRFYIFLDLKMKFNQYKVTRYCKTSTIVTERPHFLQSNDIARMSTATIDDPFVLSPTWGTCYSTS